MEEKLDFSLPEEKSRGPLAGPLAVLLLAAVVILTAANTYIARISHILLDDHQKALDAIGRAKSGEGFAELAKAISQDSTTRDSGGAIDADVVKGRYIPVIGDANGLEEAIFAAKPGEVLPEPYQSDKGWHVVQLRELTEARQRTFDEVRQDAMMTLMERKRQDVQQQFIKAMMDKYHVIIHTSAIVKTSEPSEGAPVNPRP